MRSHQEEPLGWFRGMTVKEALLASLRWAIFLGGAYHFVSAMTSGTPEDPAGLSGELAALIALHTASLAAIRAIKAGKSDNWPIWDICIGLGGMAAAYLWMVAEAEVDPLSGRLPIEILVSAVVVILTAGTTYLYARLNLHFFDFLARRLNRP